MKILLVDDTELFLDLEKSYLQRESFHFLTARSGEEALEMVRDQRPDLILLDLLMPGMDGDEVCRDLKRNPATRAIPVIMLSSDTGEGMKDRCLAAGCDAFVSKPLKRDELLEAIERMMGVAQRRHPRVPTRLTSYVRHGEREVEAWIHTISSGGVFVEMELPPDIGETFSVAFILPGHDEAIQASATVRWAGRVRPGGPSGVGAEFLLVGDAQRAAIGEYVDRKLAKVGSLKGFA
ncbi:MAG: response regulator [bacterium]|nr:MAG: response regulator [bacterium]